MMYNSVSVDRHSFKLFFHFNVLMLCTLPGDRVQNTKFMLIKSIWNDE